MVVEEEEEEEEEEKKKKKKKKKICKPPPPPPITTNSRRVFRVQEPCESRGGRPGLSVLMSLTVFVNVSKATLNHASALVTICP